MRRWGTLLWIATVGGGISSPSSAEAQCLQPSGDPYDDAYNFESLTQNNLVRGAFDVQGIACSAGYGDGAGGAGTPTPTVCTADEQPYLLTGCSRQPECLSRRDTALTGYDANFRFSYTKFTEFLYGLPSFCMHLSVTR